MLVLFTVTFSSCILLGREYGGGDGCAGRDVSQGPEGLVYLPWPRMGMAKAWLPFTHFVLSKLHRGPTRASKRQGRCLGSPVSLLEDMHAD